MYKKKNYLLPIQTTFRINNYYFKGVSNWQPASKNLQYYKTWEEVPEQWQTQIRPKMFPPKPEDVDKYHLERW